MKTNRAWWAVALLAAAVGCSKSEGPAGASAGGTASGGAAASPAAPKPAVAATPDAQIQAVFNSFAAGDAGAMWNALPPKYQSDIASIKNEFAGKMDGELWNKAFAIAGKVGTLLKTKKDFILATPAMAGVPPEVKDGVVKQWDSIVSAVNTLASSEIKSIDGLKAADPGKFISSTGNALLSTGVKAADVVDPNSSAFMTKLRKAKVTLVKQEGDVATLKLETEGEEPEEKQFKQIDGKWLPIDVVEHWDENIKGMKEDAATFAIPPEQKAQFTMVAAMVESTVDSLLNAKDQTSFDGAMAGIMALMGGGGGMMGGPPGMSGPPPSGLPTAVPAGSPLLGPPGGLPSLPPPTVSPPPVTPPSTTPALPK